MSKLQHLNPAWQAGQPERADLEWLRRQGPGFGEWEEHSHPPIFTLREVVGQKPKILAGVPGGDPLVFRQLMDCLNPPYFLLYLLHTPRGEGEPGRYQSGQLSAQTALDFLDRFGNFLRADGRHDFWLHSPSDQATIVWDRHNLIHAYGPTDAYAKVLSELGFAAGEPAVPHPHIHSYRAEFDDDARAVLETLEWRYAPLRPEDEQ